MRREIELSGRVRRVEVTRENGRVAVKLDGQDSFVDLVRVDTNTWSLLVEQVGVAPSGASGSRAGTSGGSGKRDMTAAASYEIHLSPAVHGQLLVHVGMTPLSATLDGQRRSDRKEEGGPSGSAPQRIVAPMPGKIVRVLVQPGDAVHARQPVVVIEAMKMENELRAWRDGIVSDVSARSGQSVEAGALLALIV